MRFNIKSQQGQSAIEYLIITFMVAIACLGAFKKLGTTLKEKIENTDEAISGHLNFTGKMAGK